MPWRSLTDVPSSARVEAVPEMALLRRICVGRPYFALESLAFRENRFYASAVADLPMGREVGPMGSAEISRHGAITGLCGAALAQSDDDRRFYLAQRAEYYGLPNPAPYGAPVQFAAQLESLSKRGARSSISVTAEGEPLAQLEVAYTILTEYAFKRLFRHRFRGTVPHKKMKPQPPGRRSVFAGWAQHEVAEVPEAACAGHFDDYPALPVAVLMGQLGDTAASLLGSGTFRGVRASVSANDLCWAGEQVRFEAVPVAGGFGEERGELAEAAGRLSGFSCQVVAGGRTVCTAEMLLEPR